jgi:hypothetical protein
MHKWLITTHIERFTFFFISQDNSLQLNGSNVGTIL